MPGVNLDAHTFYKTKVLTVESTGQNGTLEPTKNQPTKQDPTEFPGQNLQTKQHTPSWTP